jgi:Flp pilus assembly protein TadG
VADSNLRAKRTRVNGRSELGQAAVLSVVWMVVLLGLAGLVIDVGAWYRSQRNQQAQADAAALAGAQDLPDNTSAASSAAQVYATKNGYTLPISGISFSSAVAPDDSITVKVDHDAPTFFSKIFGLQSVPVHVEATAQTSLIGQARYVAPIAVNIKHPLLSGPGCPCFGQQTTLPLSKTGAPGAFALIDLDNATGNGSSTLGNWVLNGFAAYLGLGPYSSNTGAKFNSTDIDNALDARIGTVLMFPVYDTIVMQGTNAVYNVIGWVGFLLGGYKITGGNSGSLTGSFTEITWQGIPATQGNGPPNLGARVVTLIR